MAGQAHFLTPSEERPYPFLAIRPLGAIACLALFGCATDSTTRELHELTASVRALRAENARLDARLEKVEQQLVIANARPGARPTTAAEPKPVAQGSSPVSSADALPPLTVVKLKPKKEAAPKLNTDVAVSEPPEGLVEELRAPDDAKQGEAPDAADLAMADAQFERALDAMKTGNPEGGVAQMQQFVADWPKHPKADNALYFSGLTMMSQKDFVQAAGNFQQVITRYPAGDAVLDSMLKLAECRLKLNQTQEAKATWEKIVSSFPGTAAATQAQARLASLSPH